MTTIRTEYGELVLSEPGAAPCWCVAVAPDEDDFTVGWCTGAAPAEPLIPADASGWGVSSVVVDVGSSLRVEIVAGTPRSGQLTIAHLQAARRDPAYRDSLLKWLIGC